MTEIFTGQVAAATKKCARKWAQEKCPFSVSAWGPIKIPDTQIFLPASQPQAHHKCYDCKLRLELQLNAITCTALLWRARGLIRGGSIHFWGSGRIVVGGRNLVCTEYGIFFEYIQISRLLVEEKAPAGRLKWARHITHMYYSVSVRRYIGLFSAVPRSFPVRTSQHSWCIPSYIWNGHYWYLICYCAA